MISDTYEAEFRIPKIVMPVVCHTTWDERIAGEVFLDATGRPGRKQIIDFFCEEAPFFPIRTAQMAKPFLVARDRIVLVAIQASQPSETAGAPVEMKKAIIEVQTCGPVECEIFIDSPVDRRRVLDILNQSRRFIAVIWDKSFSLVNINHILKVVEL